jgi:ribosome-associated translation inhibitor RaiA
MQTEPEIDFEGMPATPAIKAAIGQHVAQLGERWGRITACRVMVKAPSEHHRTSGLYEVHIHLSLPDGREVNIAKTPTADVRRSDLAFAVDHAFKRARRQLQDQVCRAQGQVKRHKKSENGTVIRDSSEIDSGQGT